MLQLVLSPGHGWEDIERTDPSPDQLAASGFYPLTALTALSVFMTRIWHPTVGLSAMLVGAIVCFVMFFAGCFIAEFVITVMSPRFMHERIDNRRVRTFALMSMGLLEVITLLANCIPATMPLTWFLPAYVLLVEWKGAGYLGVRPDRMPIFVATLVLGAILPPYVLQTFFSLIMPV